mmetsp:Transcript_32170/g.68082  ORF Transcript_32170/g.68082 Transcript_32170/m.68082 type:complete len:368 (-) Transcript_32170:144-1247(-)|eukprot:CAMPEP_0183718956 /NCGR_PEP_ID=MMETSP0737-20130205/12069_1 /TAXON_ID=385413 /ORGANISM="Thalassiosira miniscula, Strain CCMP1093" /LENGTH=367 /DNA_ID=CAMNT_0025948611 /DNA_START=145 /DNA_END=1248 /DNA_ORIENTATION=-
MSRAESPFAESPFADDPFDPFSFEDEIERARSPDTIATSVNESNAYERPLSPQSHQSSAYQQSSANSASTDTSKTTNTAKRSAGTKSPTPLPPRLVLRLALHEEVSSLAVLDPDDREGGSLSQLTIEGSVRGRVESSTNVKENTPFRLIITGPMTSLANFTSADHCVIEDKNIVSDTVNCKVNIPKSELAGCEILRYSMNVRTQNMPILVQAKAAIIDNKNTCRISVQIRSNLSNRGDLSNFSIIAAIPTTLQGDTLKVTRGDHGVWDANKRIITWKIGNLPHGESCLVSAEAEISKPIAKLMYENRFTKSLAEEKIHCPILVRCLSEEDQVSDLTLSTKALKNAPAMIVQHKKVSYQLLHRVSGTN